MIEAFLHLVSSTASDQPIETTGHYAFRHIEFFDQQDRRAENRSTAGYRPESSTSITGDDEQQSQQHNCSATAEE